MILADLIQGERGHLTLTDAVLFGAVEGGEVYSARDNLIGVAVRDAPQVGVIEVELQVAAGKVIGVAKRKGCLVQMEHESAVFAVLQHQARLSVVVNSLTGGDVLNSGFHIGSSFHFVVGVFVYVHILTPCGLIVNTPPDLLKAHFFDLVARQEPRFLDLYPFFELFAGGVQLIK